MPISTARCITNLTPYDVVFTQDDCCDAVYIEDINSSALLKSVGVACCKMELVDSPITAEIEDLTGGTPVKLDACISFFCNDQNGSLIHERLPETAVGHYLLVTKEIASRANQCGMYRGIIYPAKYGFVYDQKGKRIMVISSLGTFWSHLHSKI